jgi:hypothetical protein
MRFGFPVIALAALCALLSGCGCSREKKPVDGPAGRMEDAAYTNRLVKLRSEQASVASEIAAIKAKIAKLGDDAVKKPEYVDLTNRLAKCESEAKSVQNAARQAVRARILKDAAKKGDLKK